VFIKKKTSIMMVLVFYKDSVNLFFPYKASLDSFV